MESEDRREHLTKHFTLPEHSHEAHVFLVHRETFGGAYWSQHAFLAKIPLSSRDS